MSKKIYMSLITLGIFVSSCLLAFGTSDSLRELYSIDFDINPNDDSLILSPNGEFFDNVLDHFALDKGNGYYGSSDVLPGFEWYRQLETISIIQGEGFIASIIYPASNYKETIFIKCEDTNIYFDNQTLMNCILKEKGVYKYTSLSGSRQVKEYQLIWMWYPWMPKNYFNSIHSYPFAVVIASLNDTVAFAGRVFQIVDNNGFILKIESNNTSELVFVNYEATDSLIDDQPIEGLGNPVGNYTYETLLGQKTIRLINIIEINTKPLERGFKYYKF